MFHIDKRYQYVKTIGTGAYGVVISAYDSETRRKVAIKKIPCAFEDLVDAKRIIREIKLLKHMEHENIIGLKNILVPERQDQMDDVRKPIYWFIIRLEFVDVY